MIIIIAIAFFSQWSGNGLVSYYLRNVLESIGITSSTIQLLINGFVSISLTSEMNYQLNSYPQDPRNLESLLGRAGIVLV